MTVAAKQKLKKRMYFIFRSVPVLKLKTILLNRRKEKREYQLAGASNGDVVKDNIEYAMGKDIPLWEFGFLY